MKNPPYHAIHYAYLVHEDLDGNVTYANEEQMDIAEHTALLIINIFDQHRSIRICK